MEEEIWIKLGKLIVIAFFIADQEGVPLIPLKSEEMKY